MTAAATRVRRFDRYGADALSPPQELANGWLKVEGRIARVGIQEYEDPDGTTHRELRIPDEVFAPESLASFQMVPVTNTHPPVLLDAANTGTYAKGYSGEAVRKLDEEWVGAPLMITDGATIRDVRAGRCQLSNGYTCELDPTQITDLIARWGPYKFIQRRILGNHIACVDEARAGAEARLRLDAGSARMLVLDSANVAPSQPLERNMTRIAIGSLHLDMTDGNAPAIQQAINDLLAQARRESDLKIDGLTKSKDTAQRALKIVKDNAGRLIKTIKRAHMIVDAMKAKMASCDECAGTGKIADAADPSKLNKCDFCDGSGSYRMHMPVSPATGTEEGSADGDEDDLDDLDETLGEGEMDQDELEVEQETETEAGAANKGDAKKRADARKRRTEEARANRAKLDASLRRRIERGVRARTVLDGVARRFIPATTDLSKLDSVGVMKAVIAAVSPKTKLDGMSAADVKSRFDAVVDMAGEAAQPSASDLARGLVSPFVVQERPAHADAVEVKEDGSHLEGQARMIFLQNQAAEKALRGSK